MGPDDHGPPPEERAWAAPEAAPSVSGAPAAPVPGTPAPALVADPAGGDEPPLPVPLRPMTMGDLLDGGFAVLRAQPRTVLALAAVFIVPVQLVVSFLNRNALEDLDRLIEETVNNAGASPTSTVGSTVGSVLSTVGGSLGQTLIAAGLAVMVSAWYAGGQPDLREVLGRLWRLALPLSGGWLLVHVAELLGAFAIGIGALVAMVFFIVTAPAIAVEGIGPLAGMGRSARLVSGRFWFCLGFALLSGLVASVLGQVLGLLPQLLGLVLGPDLGWIALGVGGIITQMVSTTIVGAATVLLYLDLRMRTEGMDLAYLADRHLPQ